MDIIFWNESCENDVLLVNLFLITCYWYSIAVQKQDLSLIYWTPDFVIKGPFDISYNIIYPSYCSYRILEKIMASECTSLQLLRKPVQRNYRAFLWKLKKAWTNNILTFETYRPNNQILNNQLSFFWFNYWFIVFEIP